MLLHAVFDLTLFSIPVFLVDARGALMQQALIVAAGLVPLAIILWRRARSGAWLELPPALRNGALAAARPGGREGCRRRAERADGRCSDRRPPSSAHCRSSVLPGLPPGCSLRHFAPTSRRCRSIATRQSGAQIARSPNTASRFPPDGARMATVQLANDDPQQWTWHKFVWREASPDIYRALVGAALAPPLWDVRYATFAGDVAERAEEWRVSVTGDGGVRTFRHALPEARPGAKLARARGACACRSRIARAVRARSFDAQTGVRRRKASQAGIQPDADRLVVHVRRSERQRREGR
mgnify:CR=1 FL=1